NNNNNNNNAGYGGGGRGRGGAEVEEDPHAMYDDHDRADLDDGEIPANVAPLIDENEEILPINPLDDDDPNLFMLDQDMATSRVAVTIPAQVKVIDNNRNHNNMDVEIEQEVEDKFVGASSTNEESNTAYPLHAKSGKTTEDKGTDELVSNKVWQTVKHGMVEALDEQHHRRQSTRLLLDSLRPTIEHNQQSSRTDNNINGNNNNNSNNINNNINNT
ncbi:hypothetical protein RFI_28838, partial [Reticulomyxa filosa]